MPPLANLPDPPGELTQRSVRFPTTIDRLELDVRTEVADVMRVRRAVLDRMKN